MPSKSRPRYLNSPFSDFFTKWMSRLNTFLYRRGGGEGLGSTFQAARPAATDQPVICDPAR